MKYRVFKFAGVEPITKKKVWLDMQAEADTQEKVLEIIDTFKQSDPRGTYKFTIVPDDINTLRKED